MRRRHISPEKTTTKLSPKITKEQSGSASRAVFLSYIQELTYKFSAILYIGHKKKVFRTGKKGNGK